MKKITKRKNEIIEFLKTGLSDKGYHGKLCQHIAGAHVFGALAGVAKAFT